MSVHVRVCGADFSAVFQRGPHPGLGVRWARGVLEWSQNRAWDWSKTDRAGAHRNKSPRQSGTLTHGRKITLLLLFFSPTASSFSPFLPLRPPAVLRTHNPAGIAAHWTKGPKWATDTRGDSGSNLIDLICCRLVVWLEVWVPELRFATAAILCPKVTLAHKLKHYTVVCRRPITPLAH